MTIITNCMIISDGCASNKRKRQFNLSRFTTLDKQLLQANILYLRHQGAILVIPHMSLPISTTTASKLLTLHDIKHMD